jgi:hypothetical protein
MIIRAIIYSFTLKMGPDAGHIPLGPVLGPKGNRSCVRTQFSWVQLQDPIVLSLRQDPSLMGPVSGPHSIGPCVRTHSSWVCPQ